MRREEMSIFRAYDIRGIWGEELNEEVCEKLAKAIGSFALSKGFSVVALGRDGRRSSPIMYEIIKDSLVKQGINVYELGMVSTPVFYYSVIRTKAPFGIMITASHNPKEFNGIKMCYGKALPLSYEHGIREIENIYLNSDFKPYARKENQGRIKKIDGIALYIQYISKLFKAVPLKFAVDVSNGPQALVMKQLGEELEIHPIVMNDEINGDFPGHLPNPLEEEALEELRARVREDELNFGVCFDGDGDRIALVDEKGKRVLLDALFSLFIKHELMRSPGETVYYDLRFSKVVEKTILKYRGIPYKMRVGNPFYKAKLIKEGGILGGELSGHIMFARNYAIDDPIFALLRLLEIIRKERKPVSELMKEFGPIYKSGEINFRVKNPDAIIERIEESFSNLKIEKIDGISVYDKEWWFNLRKSNTEPLLRLNIEADNEILAEKKKEELKKLIKEFDEEEKRGR